LFFANFGVHLGCNFALVITDVLHSSFCSEAAGYKVPSKIPPEVIPFVVPETPQNAPNPIMAQDPPGAVSKLVRNVLGNNVRRSLVIPPNTVQRSSGLLVPDTGTRAHGSSNVFVLRNPLFVQPSGITTSLMQGLHRQNLPNYDSNFNVVPSRNFSSAAETAVVPNARVRGQSHFVLTSDILEAMRADFQPYLGADVNCGTDNHLGFQGALIKNLVNLKLQHQAHHENSALGNTIYLEIKVRASFSPW